MKSKKNQSKKSKQLLNKFIFVLLDIVVMGAIVRLCYVTDVKISTYLADILVVTSIMFAIYTGLTLNAQERQTTNDFEQSRQNITEQEQKSNQEQESNKSEQLNNNPQIKENT